MVKTTMKPVRINKYLSEVGHCSRREGDRLIEEGRVTINGIIPEKGTKVNPGDNVQVDGVSVRPSNAQRIYIAYNKPIGVTCTTDLRIKGNIIEVLGRFF